ncbi:hypothetical protein SY83_12545 [Paenibacillus swuensis]|uniref:Protein kinase domain-containing protein n=1 Tax=Paenibacillus swuensis TaxID=1178515 RepID=A0A172TIT2_9BACL|nr:protein kinase [Paenibacillus swuensis]ANE46965.1 hypothetical protein SY83_12545 [Paenibacillus swuensis]
MFNYLRQRIEAWKDYPQRSGKRIGPYRIERYLGIGSYGITYICTNVRTGEALLLKQAKPSKGRRALELLRRESGMLKRLKDERIPAYHDFLDLKKSGYMVSELVHGSTVEELIFLEGRTFTEAEIVHFMLRLSDIVKYIHAQGIVHLDLRIPNVIVSEEDRLHVIDFGLARMIGDAIEDLPLTEPEEELAEFRLRRTPAVESDFYAMGHFMLFMLYAEYEPSPDEPERGWEEQLTLSAHVKGALRRLLQLDSPYRDADELQKHLILILNTLTD